MISLSLSNGCQLVSRQNSVFSDGTIVPKVQKNLQNSDVFHSENQYNK